MIDLEGKRAVVTGGSQGLGRGFSLMLARQGANVAIAYLRRADEDASAAEETAGEIEALGRRALLVEADVTETDEVERLCGEVKVGLGGVDILVNNVGGFPSRPMPIVELSEDDWDRSIRLNLRSVFLCCRAFAREMICGGRGGRIVNISASLSAATGVPGSSHYSASKAGVVSLTKALARELAASSITVNAVAPGHVDTPMNRLGAEAGWWSDEKELEGIALRRMGTVEDVGAAVAFFASEEAGWITGQTLHVNGGSYMQ